MTKKECKKLVLDLKENMDRDFERNLDELLEFGGLELEKADCNYGYARSVFAALLLKNARSFDSDCLYPTRNVTIRVSKNAAILNSRY